jgi:diketogulonate reductase-like aldo/keto reductase
MSISRLPSVVRREELFITSKLWTDTSIMDTWKAMLALRNTGKVNAVGVSNFTIQYLEAIIIHQGDGRAACSEPGRGAPTVAAR